ncbi:hypothetical protein DL762_008675 [Monosporascus cannonballus]|uniref:RRM domain-containing protein n=1 Tax=Monosporascus cannonballus TaxID=155416 RepID=A0ABY0GW26_9PEZI|nr:hypothetical protein DL762_008675 [Monosporascus cannonballus]
MANPVGEDSWLAYVEEESRHASDLEARVKVVELFKNAVNAEPGSLKVWLAYCEYFWSLFIDCQSGEAGWPEEEQMLGRELFSFDAALSLWNEGYEAIKYRLSDSHEFWNRWISIELDQLARTRTPVGVRRISHLFRDRLQIPHATWDNTSQMYSSFLSTYNNAAYESEFKEVTKIAQEAKSAYELREPHELKLSRAVRSGDEEAQKTALREYLDWEMAQVGYTENPALTVSLCLGLYSRALTGIFSFDEEIWSNYTVYLSGRHHDAKKSRVRYLLPNMLDVLQRATTHCPWCGQLWARYILAAEVVGLSFQNVEAIKHAATNTKALEKDGMTGILDMYAAWCGYLKRTAMDPSAHEDAADVAEVGLLAALEDVHLWGERLYKDTYRGDPNYRLERILIQFLTEVKGEIDQARSHWVRMSKKEVLADSYDFWLNYYLWEMMVYASTPRARSPTPATPSSKTMRVPELATNVLHSAVSRKTMDWPERLMDVYLQHCNDYEQPDALHYAMDTVYRARKRVAKRRERENAQAAAAYAAQVQAAHPPAANTMTEDATVQDSPSGSKRKREATPDDAAQGATKRAKNADVNEVDVVANEQHLKRDRENTSVMVTNMPPDVTATAIKKYFREYGHINQLNVQKEADGSSSALIEFRSTEDVKSALLRDNKYFGQSQIRVKPGTGLTLYLSNYPPSADETYIRDLFKDCGDIFSIRWPSLKYNTHRRFCYVTFRDADAAYKATQKDGNSLEGKYKLQCKYSDPAHKKHREGAVAEGREVKVKNVDPKATENDIKSVFGRYGKVATVRIITNLSGKNLGTAYVTYETKEAAESALELNDTKFKSQILHVELSKETNYKPFSTIKGDRGSTASPPASATDGDVPMPDEHDGSRGRSQGPSPQEIRARTLALMNIPDTANDARIRSVVEKHGDIVKLVLRPDHEGAIIEFADPVAVGRASLALDGFEIAPGRKIRTGNTSDLFKEKSERGGGDVPSAPAGGKKPGFMPPTQNVRRPAPGRGGPKRMLGFVAAPKKQDGDNREDTKGNDASAAKSKSNADFKAMFLNSGNQPVGGGGSSREAEGEQQGGKGAAGPGAAVNGTKNASP